MNYLLFHNCSGIVKRCPAPAWAESALRNWRSVKNRTLKQRFWMLAADVVYGLKSHIPICCIATFLWREQRDKQPAAICNKFQDHPQFACCPLHEKLYHKKQHECFFVFYQ